MTLREKLEQISKELRLFGVYDGSSSARFTEYQTAALIDVALAAAIADEHGDLEAQWCRDVAEALSRLDKVLN